MPSTQCSLRTVAGIGKHLNPSSDYTQPEVRLRGSDQHLSQTNEFFRVGFKRLTWWIRSKNGPGSRTKTCQIVIVGLVHLIMIITTKRLDVFVSMTMIMTTKITSLGLYDDDDDDVVELIDCRNPLHFLNTIFVSSPMYL